MRCINQLLPIREYPRIAVALGTFDGLHLGHRQIIGRAVALAHQSAGTSVVFTFSNHPLSMIAPERCPPLLLSEKDKVRLLTEMGLDILMTIPFTPDFLQLPPTAFIELLLTYLRPEHVVVGPNYTFGYKGQGTPATLRTAGYKHGFNVHVPVAVTLNNELASSTLIRQFVAAGNVEQAAEYLGRFFSLTGTVIHGDARGRLLGYPTANIAIPQGMVVPANGVYAVRVLMNGAEYKGVANIGSNPTFGGKQQRLEVFILDFAGSLYGQEITVSFYSRLRSEIHFENAELLIDQITQDIRQVKQLFLTDNHLQ